jgi:hypothetical protein
MAVTDSFVSAGLVLGTLMSEGVVEGWVAFALSLMVRVDVCGVAC